MALDLTTPSPTRRARRGAPWLVAALIVPVAGLAGWLASAAAEPAVAIPAPAIDEPAHGGTETAVLAGGCFWGVQAVFQHVKGVEQAVSGYAGGMRTNPSYEEVSTGRTGHAESVQIRFDPHEISYGQILQVYFSVAHNPTEVNRQGPDTGTQYRSEIFVTDPGQRKVAEAYVAQLNQAHVFNRPIATKIGTGAFFPAEGYHQDYAINHPDNPYIAFNDLPKVDNLKRMFPDLYRDTPVTVASATR
jgi:peptide-methionine (S)-S-oxide reductase